MKAILLGNGKRQGVLDGVAALRPEIEKVVDVVAADFENKLDLTTVAADIALVFGGDGSVLRSIHQMGENQLPILAVNLGTLGFLSSVDPHELIPFLESDAFKKFEIREQLLLNCSVWRKRRDDVDPPDFKSISPRLCSRAIPTNWLSGVSERYCLSNQLVVNEVALRGSAPFSIVKIGLAVDGELVAAFRGDGLVLATPVGSTGHSLSAGGPILRNDLATIVITPLAPQTMNFRSVVDSASRTYEMQAATGEVYLVVDGDSRLKLDKDDVVVVRRAPFAFKMIVVPNNRYYRNLQRKLDWAVDAVERWKHR